VPGYDTRQARTGIKRKRRFVMEELSVLVESLIDTMIGLTVLIMLFSTGLGMTFQQVTVLWRKPGKLAKSLLAAVVLAPFVSYVVLYVAGLIMAVPEEVFVGVMLLSAASGSALAPKLAEKVGADIGEATSLMVTLAIMTIVSAPVVVAVTMPPELTLSGADVAATIFKSVLLPLIVGLAIRTWWVRLADIITEPLTKLSNSLLNVIIILIIVKDLDVILDFGLSIMVMILVLSAIYVLMGHLLGGPALPDRMTLGVSTAQRNGAIAMMVAAQALPSAVPAIVGFGVVVLVVIVLYLGTFANNSEEAGKATISVANEPHA
jgi:BASS family bile acid:Na+ symporter